MMCADLYSIKLHTSANLKNYREPTHQSKVLKLSTGNNIMKETLI